MKRNTGVSRDAFFLDTARGSRFVIATAPAGLPRGGWLYVHPFAEEMNKSRRMVAMSAHALAEHGWVVAQIDLGGCGDSEGDFGDAYWQSWLDDISDAWEWLQRQYDTELGLWTLRAGSLLAADWLEQTQKHIPLVLWQPIRNGRQHLRQFLRLKAASELLSDNAKGVVSKLRAELDDGRTVEIAGYRLSPALAAGLEAAELRLPATYEAPTTILEVIGAGRSEPSPGTAALASAWRNAGLPVTLEVAAGPSFWQTVEIEIVPALIEATVRAAERAR